MGAGVTVSNSDDLSSSANLKTHQIVSNSNDAAFCVGNRYSYDTNVFAIGIDSSAVRR